MKGPTTPLKDIYAGCKIEVCFRSLPFFFFFFGGVRGGGGWVAGGGGCPSIQYPRCAGDATLTLNRNSSAVGYQDYPGQAVLQSRVVKSQADESKGLRA